MRSLVGKQRSNSHHKGQVKTAVSEVSNELSCYTGKAAHEVDSEWDKYTLTKKYKTDISFKCKHLCAYAFPATLYRYVITNLQMYWMYLKIGKYCIGYNNCSSILYIYLKYLWPEYLVSYSDTISKCLCPALVRTLHSPKFSRFNPQIWYFRFTCTLKEPRTVKIDPESPTACLIIIGSGMKSPSNCFQW